MNAPDPDESAVADRARRLPRPVLRAAARARSLEAALAAVEPAAPPRRRRLLSPQRLVMAACWAMAGYFRLTSPPGPESGGPAVSGEYAAWRAGLPARTDDETARLLAALYPAPDSPRRAFLSDQNHEH